MYITRKKKKMIQRKFLFFKFYNLFFVCFVITWVCIPGGFTSMGHIVKGRIHNRVKRDTDIMAECDMECKTENEIGEYDIIMEYEYEEYENSLSYSDFNKPSCLHVCKVLDVNETDPESTSPEAMTHAPVNSEESMESELSGFKPLETPLNLTYLHALYGVLGLKLESTSPKTITTTPIIDEKTTTPKLLETSNLDYLHSLYKMLGLSETDLISTLPKTMTTMAIDDKKSTEIDLSGFKPLESPLNITYLRSLYEMLGLSGTDSESTSAKTMTTMPIDDIKSTETGLSGLKPLESPLNLTYLHALFEMLGLNETLLESITSKTITTTPINDKQSTEINISATKQLEKTLNLTYIRTLYEMLHLSGTELELTTPRKMTTTPINGKTSTETDISGFKQLESPLNLTYLHTLYEMLGLSKTSLESTSSKTMTTTSSNNDEEFTEIEESAFKHLESTLNYLDSADGMPSLNETVLESTTSATMTTTPIVDKPTTNFKTSEIMQLQRLLNMTYLQSICEILSLNGVEVEPTSDKTVTTSPLNTDGTTEVEFSEFNPLEYPLKVKSSNTICKLLEPSTTEFVTTSHELITTTIKYEKPCRTEAADLKSPETLPTTTSTIPPCHNSAATTSEPENSNFVHFKVTTSKKENNDHITFTSTRQLPLGIDQEQVKSNSQPSIVLSENITSDNRTIYTSVPSSTTEKQLPQVRVIPKFIRLTVLETEMVEAEGNQSSDEKAALSMRTELKTLAESPMPNISLGLAHFNDFIGSNMSNDSKTTQDNTIDPFKVKDLGATDEMSDFQPVLPKISTPLFQTLSPILSTTSQPEGKLSSGDFTTTQSPELTTTTEKGKETKETKSDDSGGLTIVKIGIVINPLVDTSVLQNKEELVRLNTKDIAKLTPHLPDVVREVPEYEDLNSGNKMMVGLTSRNIDITTKTPENISKQTRQEDGYTEKFGTLENIITTRPLFSEEEAKHTVSIVSTTQKITAASDISENIPTTARQTFSNNVAENIVNKGSTTETVSVMTSVLENISTTERRTSKTDNAENIVSKEAKTKHTLSEDDPDSIFSNEIATIITTVPGVLEDIFTTSKHTLSDDDGAENTVSKEVTTKITTISGDLEDTTAKHTLSDDDAKNTVSKEATSKITTIHGDLEDILTTARYNLSDDDIENIVSKESTSQTISVPPIILENIPTPAKLLMLVDHTENIEINELTAQTNTVIPGVFETNLTTVRHTLLDNIENILNDEPTSEKNNETATYLSEIIEELKNPPSEINEPNNTTNNYTSTHDENIGTTEVKPLLSYFGSYTPVNDENMSNDSHTGSSSTTDVAQLNEAEEEAAEFVLTNINETVPTVLSQNDKNVRREPENSLGHLADIFSG